MILVSHHMIVWIFRTMEMDRGMYVNPLESVFRPVSGKIARMVDVTGEIIGFPPMKKLGSRILMAER